MKATAKIETLKAQRNHGQAPQAFCIQTGAPLTDKAIWLWSVVVIQAGVACPVRLCATLCHASEVAAELSNAGYEIDLVARTEYAEASFGLLTVD